MSFSKKREVFFITKNFNKKIEKKSDIVLSPEFYWAKRVSLGIKSSYKVRQMAESIFDGILPSSKFEYKVLKISSNNFIIIAYNLKEIQKELSSLGVDKSMINKIYTAQSEFLNNDISIKVNKDYGISSVDGIIVYTPIQLLDNTNIMSIESILVDKKLSKHHLSFQKFDKIKLSKKELNAIMFILMLLNAIVITDIIKQQKDINSLREQKISFIEINNLPQTSFQLQSMQDEFLKIELPQKELRESIFYINKFKLTSNESFKLIKFNKNRLTYKIKLDNKKRENEFKKYISKKSISSVTIEVYK